MVVKNCKYQEAILLLGFFKIVTSWFIVKKQINEQVRKQVKQVDSELILK